MKIFYYRHLPHYQPPHATYLVTFRLAGSLPFETIERLKQERKHNLRRIAAIAKNKERLREYHDYQASYFKRFEELLDGSTTGPQWLTDHRVAQVVADAMHHFLAPPHELLCYCIMPNHVHLICRLCDPLEEDPDSARQDSPRESFPLTRILRRVKGLTSRQANLILGRSGTFWQHESYDHVIRDENELERTFRYVITNPVKAQLVGEWEKWPWSYSDPRFLEST